MPPPFQSTADAVQRETDWLTSFGDGLPALLVDNGGRWDEIQPYKPRTPAQRRNQIWVLRSRLRVVREGNVRSIAKYQFELHLIWTLSNSGGDAQADQAQFDLAINDLVMRILGVPPGVTATNPTGATDKTHGARFLSVAEIPGDVDVAPLDPPANVAGATWAAACTYTADDWDFNN